MKLSIKDLVLRTLKNDKGIFKRVQASKVVGTRSRKNVRRFIFHVKSSLHYSSKKGHLVSFLFPNITVEKLKKDKTLKPTEQRVRMWCSCPAWQMWGSAYHSTTDKYNIDGKSESIAPNIRDPNKKRLVCKHVYAVYKDIKDDNFIRLYNRFRQTYYRKQKQKKKRSDVADSILLFIFNYLEEQGKTQSEAISILNTLIAKDEVEDFLLKEGLIV